MTSSTTLSIVKWIARILSLIMVTILLMFFFGEGDFSQPIKLTWQEIIAIIFFPIGVVSGMVVAWWREKLGAIIGISSLVLFYLLDIVFTSTPPSGIWFLVFSSPLYFFAFYGLKKS